MQSAASVWLAGARLLGGLARWGASCGLASAGAQVE